MSDHILVGSDGFAPNSPDMLACSGKGASYHLVFTPVYLGKSVSYHLVFIPADCGVRTEVIFYLSNG